MELLPTGHLNNARRALRRYVDAGSPLELGSVLDELDELQALVDDVALALDSLADTARATRTTAGERTALALVNARNALMHTTLTTVQPARIRLLSEVVRGQEGRPDRRRRHGGAAA